MERAMGSTRRARWNDVSRSMEINVRPRLHLCFLVNCCRQIFIPWWEVDSLLGSWGIGEVVASFSVRKRSGERRLTADETHSLESFVRRWQERSVRLGFAYSSHRLGTDSSLPRKTITPVSHIRFASQARMPSRAKGNKHP